MSFRLVEAQRAQHPVSLLCSVLGVTRAGFCAWKRREPCAREKRDRELAKLVVEIHCGSKATYGVPRIHAELGDDHGIHVSRKRLARLMRQAGIEGVSRRGKRPVTTVKAPEPPAAQDLVRRKFEAPAPDRLWVADITYVPTREGYLFHARIEVFDFIEGFYNPRRRHSALGYLSPERYETMTSITINKDQGAAEAA